MARKRNASPATTRFVEPPKVRSVCAHCHEPGLIGSEISIYSTAPKVETDLHSRCYAAWKAGQS